MYLLIGLPGSGVEWCERVSQLLLRRENRPDVAHPIDAPEILARELGQALCSPGFFIARNPNPAIIRWARSREFRLVFVRRDPRDCVASLVASGAVDFDQALRQVAIACVTIEGALKGGERIAIAHDDIRSAPVRVAAELARSMGLSLQAEFGDDPDFQGLHQAFLVDAAARPLTQEQTEIVDGALRFFAGPEVQNGADCPIYWPRSLFYLGDRPGRLVTGRIALIGGARCIFYGPHLLLPTGKWRADTAIAVSKEAVGSSFAFELWADGVVAKRVEKAIAPGLLQNRLLFELATPGTPVQIRIFTERSAIEGHVALGGTIVTRLG